MARSNVINRIVSLVGSTTKIVDGEARWPSIVDVQVGRGAVRVAMHGAAFAKKSYRGRDAIERRMQNPGQDHPVLHPAGVVPIIIGLWDEERRPVLVGFDATTRIGDMTRKSFFGALAHLRVAADQGWTSYRSGSDEEVFAFWPQMLPAYVDMVARGVRLDPDDMARVVTAAGLTDDRTPLSPEERIRRTTTALVRRAAFSAEVVSAYDKLCAMCGLDFGLVQGAHIYPASAPGSSDNVRNGLALCANHHSAFDRHLVHVHPKSRRIRLHPALLAGAAQSKACKSFVETTAAELRDPAKPKHRPHPDMFVKRYDHFDEAYGWSARFA